MKIAVAGYGMLGAAVEQRAAKSRNFELVGIFTKRPVSVVRNLTHTPVYPFDEISKHADEVDVMINCMGSATELTVITPYLSKYYNTVDSFEIAERFNEHFMRTDRYAKESGKLSLIGCGWKTGLFSLLKAYNNAFDESSAYDFSFRGISRGHTNALKNIEGVHKALVYSSKGNELICTVVPDRGADTAKIENELVLTEHYFKGHDIKVNFVKAEEFEHELNLRTASESEVKIIQKGSDSFSAFTLRLSSEVDFSAKLLLAYSKAVWSMYKKGKSGCMTVCDVPVSEICGKGSILI